MSPLSGNAGFRYTPAGGSIKTHRLAFPMELQMAPAHRKRRYISDSLDGSAREVVSIASGRAEVEATLRFNRNSQDLLDMLEHAADGLVLTYYPDLSVNTSYAMWLVSSGDEVALAQDGGRYGFGEYEVRVRFRDASASGTSLEALFSPWLFKYEAGMAVPGAVFTRTGTARQIGQFGVLESVATGLPRDGHWPLVDGVRTPAYLGEAGTNLVTSDNIASGWTLSGAAVTSSVSDPLGGTGAYTVTDDGGAAVEYAEFVPSFTGDGTKTLTFAVKERTMPASETQDLLLRDNTASTNRLRLTIDSWSSGDPQVTAVTGTLVEKRSLGDGWWLLRAQAVGVVAANSNRIRIVPAATTGSNTGAIDVWRVNAFDVPHPPYMPRDASGGPDFFQVPISFAPQGLTVYSKWIERGTSQMSGSERYWHIGGPTGLSEPRMALRHTANTGEMGAFFDDGPFIESVSGAGAVSVGDVVETRVVVFLDGADWKIQLHYAINGAAEVSASAATIGTSLPSSWSADTFTIGAAPNGTDAGICEHLSVKIASDTKTLAEMRAL